MSCEKARAVPSGHVFFTDLFEARINKRLPLGEKGGNFRLPSQQSSPYFAAHKESI
jgi:hypothetical protein